MRKGTMHSLTLLASFITSTTAHGYVQGILAGSSKTYYSGYHPSFQYHHPIPIVAGWSTPKDIDNGFIDPTKYSSPNIICHREATPAGLAVEIPAGETLELQWTVWPESHHGPVIDYLAKCPSGEGGCERVDKTELEFVKIGERGMVNWDDMPGKWASDELISNNNSWSITIPPSLAPGFYVLRHEIISLHSANNHNGAQNYPQCISLNITSSSSSDDENGTEDLSSAGGIPAAEFYTNEDPGIAVNIYESQSMYLIPGPTLWSGAAKDGGMKQTIGSTGYALSSTGLTSETTAYTSSSPTASPSPSSSDDDENGDGSGKDSATTCTSSPIATPPPPPTTTAPPPKNSETTTAASEASPYSKKIQSLIDSLPSEALTKPIPIPTDISTTPTPSNSNSENEESGWDEIPEKQLPEGWTLRDLLDWVQWGMEGVWKEGEEEGKGGRDGSGEWGGGKREGRHSRDFWGKGGRG